MTAYINFLIISFLIVIQCSGQQKSLSELCNDIRNTPQMIFPDRLQDGKIKLIRELRKFDSEEASDSLKSVFLSIDTTKRGFWEYKYESLYILSEKNTRKSLEVLSEIIRDYPLENPASMFFIWDLVSNTKNVSVMFPNLTQSLGKQKWTDGHILLMIINASRKGHLTGEQLQYSKDDLINFYRFLKAEKNALQGFKHYPAYYSDHVTELLNCLRLFPPDEEINQVYEDVLAENSSFKEFCSVGFAAYNNDSKRKLNALFQAIAGLLQNNKAVNGKYLELMAAEPLYHNQFYRELLKLNRDSVFPTKYLSQEYFAISDLAYIKEHSANEGLPDCFNFLGKREIASGNNKGVYYFYQSSYGDKSESIMMELSGPQPLNKTEFVLSATKTHRFNIGKCSKTEIEQKMDNTMKTISGD